METNVLAAGGLAIPMKDRLIWAAIALLFVYLGTLLVIPIFNDWLQMRLVSIQEIILPWVRPAMVIIIMDGMLRILFHLMGEENAREIRRSFNILSYF